MGKITKLGKNKFVSFLSVLVAAKEPLPLALAERVFPETRMEFLQALLNCMTSLFLVNEDGINFTHKLVEDQNSCKTLSWIPWRY